MFTGTNVVSPEDPEDPEEPDDPEEPEEPEEPPESEPPISTVVPDGALLVGAPMDVTLPVA
jgi:hypothetical protein